MAVGNCKEMSSSVFTKMRQDKEGILISLVWVLWRIASFRRKSKLSYTIIKLLICLSWLYGVLLLGSWNLFGNACSNIMSLVVRTFVSWLFWWFWILRLESLWRVSVLRSFSFHIISVLRLGSSLIIMTIIVSSTLWGSRFRRKLSRGWLLGIICVIFIHIRTLISTIGFYTWLWAKLSIVLCWCSWIYTFAWFSWGRRLSPSSISLVLIDLVALAILVFTLLGQTMTLVKWIVVVETMLSEWS